MEILNVGLGEMVVIVIIALLVFGPEKLPEVARQVARLFSQVRSATDDVRRVLSEETANIKQPIEEARREIESIAKPIDDIQKQVKSIRNPIDTISKDIKSGIDEIKSAGSFSSDKPTASNSPSTTSEKSSTSP